MSETFEPFYIFEHPSFNDVYDAQRQSRLYGFRFRAEHTKYETLCHQLKQRVSKATLEEYLATPLEAVPDNSALYIVRIRPEGRESILPALLAEALALGFVVHDDYRGQCHCPEGVWTVDGLRPHE
ncbi:MAG TPA: hypothetical protein VIU34_21670 [Steroidobacter sp.]